MVPRNSKLNNRGGVSTGKSYTHSDGVSITIVWVASTQTRVKHTAVAVLFTYNSTSLVWVGCSSCGKESTDERTGHPCTKQRIEKA